MKDELFRREESGSQFGTTAWAMNVLCTSNAKKGPHKAMNAYSEFNDKELDGQIIAITMKYFGMKKFDGEFRGRSEVDIFAKKKIVLIPILLIIK